MQLENHLLSSHSQIESTWQAIRHAKGYSEWLNANVTCYLVKVQMDIIITQLTSIQKPESKCIACNHIEDMDLDHLYQTMTKLWNELIGLPIHACDRHSWNNILIQKNILYNNLVRVLYFVK